MTPLQLPFPLKVSCSVSWSLMPCAKSMALSITLDDGVRAKGCVRAMYSFLPGLNNEKSDLSISHGIPHLPNSSAETLVSSLLSLTP